MRVDVDDPVWFITGASAGLGLALAVAALERGDRVVAAARRSTALRERLSGYGDRALVVALDVTDGEAVAAAVRDAAERFGQFDVIVNNAGRGLVGALEETTDRQFRELMDLHLFGPVALIRAVLPYLRARRRGTIVQISSFGAAAPAPGFTAYAATKAALEGLSASLKQELAPFGIAVIVVQPGALRTEFAGPPLEQAAQLPAYDETVGAVRSALAASDGRQGGDPARAAQVILAAVDSDAPPSHLALGADAIERLLAHTDQVRADWLAWTPPGRDIAFRK